MWVKLALASRVLLLGGILECQAYKLVQDYEPQGHEAVNASKVPLYKELVSALPLVLQNLTNFTGLINNRGVESENITHQFGELESDLALLSDKVSGFYAVMHEMLPDGRGQFLCPLGRQSRIKECLLLATCLLEYHVPQDIELAHFMTYMEMTQRYIDIGWQALKKALLFEEQQMDLDMDHVAPQEYQCDQLKHQETKTLPGLMQVEELDGSTLAMSSAVVHASQSSFQILEAHALGGSVDATILKLHELWRPICKELHCDHSNFWDLNYASYRQTAALLELHSAVAARRAARKEIEHRVRLEKRVADFVAENEHYYAMANVTGVGRRFVQPGLIQESSRAARKQLIAEGRQAFMKHIMPTTQDIANEDQQRGLRLFDQVEFRKFQKRKRGYAASVHAEEALQDDEDAPAGFEDHGGALALLETEEDAEDAVDSGSGRRRRRLIGGRRRSRRRRRIFKVIEKEVDKAVDKVSNAAAELVEDIVHFMEDLLRCAGIAVEFMSTGYDYEVVPGAVSVSLGLSTGAKQALEDLISEKPPRAFLSLDFGFAVGITKKLAWAGVGLGGSLACDTSATCEAYITAATYTSVNLPTPNPAACPMGPTWGPATCAQSFGGGISAMCCTLGLQKGQNDCR